MRYFSFCALEFKRKAFCLSSFDFFADVTYIFQNADISVAIPVGKQNFSYTFLLRFRLHCCRVSSYASMLVEYSGIKKGKGIACIPGQKIRLSLFLSDQENHAAKRVSRAGIRLNGDSAKRKGIALLQMRNVSNFADGI